MDELRLKSILKDIDGINQPKNNFNPYMGAPQQFKEDHMSVKNGLISELKKTGIKILVNVGIIAVLILLYYCFR
jgi:hypothetical protein